LPIATFGRMGEIALTAVRVAEFSVGDRVPILGLGLVGNLAAQLFRLAGAEVMDADLPPFRLERARQCGIEQVANPQEESLEEAVMVWRGGVGRTSWWKVWGSQN